MEDFKFFGGRWPYGLKKEAEKVETFFLLSK